MKKIIFTVLACLLTTLCVNAAFDATTRVSTVGNKITSTSGLPTVTYSVVDTETTNSSIATSKKLYVLKSNLSYTGNDNEVAAIVSQEFGAIINSAANKKDVVNSVSSSLLGKISDEKFLNVANMTKEYAVNNMSEKDQMNADITGVDLMIKAGYNPLAMIVVLGKMPASVTDTIKSQPANFKRTMNIYNYLAYNYPDAVKKGYACNEYKTFIAYIQPTLDKRNSNKAELTKFQKEQAQAKKDREKQLLKYKVTGGTDQWNIAKTLLEKK